MTSPPLEFTYELTPELSRAATWRFFQHQLGWRVPLGVLAYSAACGLLLMMGATLLTGIFIGAGLLLVVLVIAAYVVRRRRNAGLLEIVTDRAARCRITGDGIELHTQLGTSIFPWRAVKKVVRFPDVWLLYLGPQPIWLPADALHGDAGAAVLERAAQHRAKVVLR